MLSVLLATLFFNIAAGDLQPRIINGQPAFSNHFHYIVSIQSSSLPIHYCAGSIITEYWVLTAAHCFLEECPGCGSDDVVVIYNTHHIFGVRGIKNPVRQIKSHENHDPSSKTNDIALVQVQWSLFSPPIGRFGTRAIKIGVAEVNREALVAGWGTVLRDSQVASRQLMYTRLWTTESNDFCHNDEHFFCAVGLNGGGPCEGDCGGPVIVKEEIGDVLIGVVPHREHDCADGYPDRYTKLYPLADWIANVTGIENKNKLLA